MKFSIGDKVMVEGKVGEIILWRFDEGDVWEVEIDGVIYDCYNEEMSHC